MLFEKLKNKKVLLASKSPRRKEILENLGITFEIIVKDGIDETIPDGINNETAAVYLSEKKAKSYTEHICENTILITADTIVCLDDEILTKPKNYDDAFRILSILSGRKHKVITGVCIRLLNKQISFADTTYVYFKKLTNEEIDYYIKNYKPYDKAGAYGIQEWIGYIGIEKIEGSYFNVVGLPINKIYKTLNKLL